MKSNPVLSHLSSAAVLDALGLQPKPTLRSRALTYTGFVAAGVVVGAAAVLLLTSKPGRKARAELRQAAEDHGQQVRASATRAVAAAKRTVSGPNSDADDDNAIAVNSLGGA